MDRRRFLTAGAAAVGALIAGPAFNDVLAAPRHRRPRPATFPYGPLGGPDRNGIRLPRGFSSRVLARGEEVVPGTRHRWHRFPDGGATFPSPDGGWVYTSNSELPIVGGAGALRFDRSGNVVDGYRILTGTSLNCAGGPTPWGTWLSCEEHPAGLVWECDPQRPGSGVPRPALGSFSHEAVAVDPVGRRLYLTEDDTTGDSDGFYRFTPDRYPDLTSGLLEAAALRPDGTVEWRRVGPTVPMGLQRILGRTATTFDGAEGAWYHLGHVFFTTKSDNRVWDLDVADNRISVLYDAEAYGPKAPLRGVDNVVVSRSGDIYVGEDGGEMRLALLTPGGHLSPMLQVVGQDDSEITGPAFDPSGRRLYFSSQRGGGGAGITYEIAGLFRQP